MPAGLPSELLDRRPDVRVAEQSLAAATANIGQAKALLFPRIALTGSFGFTSTEFDTLVRRAEQGLEHPRQSPAADLQRGQEPASRRDHGVAAAADPLRIRAHDPPGLPRDGGRSRRLSEDGRAARGPGQPREGRAEGAGAGRAALPGRRRRLPRGARRAALAVRRRDRRDADDRAATSSRSSSSTRRWAAAGLRRRTRRPTPPAPDGRARDVRAGRRPRPPARRPAPDIARIVFAVLFIGGLIAFSFWILKPFLFATLWATTIVVATWPVMLLVQARLWNRRWLAVVVMTGILLLVFIVPFTIGAQRHRDQRRGDHGTRALPHDSRHPGPAGVDREDPVPRPADRHRLERGEGGRTGKPRRRRQALRRQRGALVRGLHRQPGRLVRPAPPHHDRDRHPLRLRRDGGGRSAPLRPAAGRCARRRRRPPGRAGRPRGGPRRGADGHRAVRRRPASASSSPACPSPPS